MRIRLKKAEVVVRDELPDQADEHRRSEQRHVERELVDVAPLPIAVEEQRQEEREREDEEDRLDDVDRGVLDRPRELRVVGDLTPVLEADELRRVEEAALVEAEPDRPEDRNDEEREEGDEVREGRRGTRSCCAASRYRAPARRYSAGSASARPRQPLSLPPTSSPSLAFVVFRLSS